MFDLYQENGLQTCLQKISKNWHYGMLVWAVCIIDTEILTSTQIMEMV